jgi:hypothetical protein
MSVAASNERRPGRAVANNLEIAVLVILRSLGGHFKSQSALGDLVESHSGDHPDRLLIHGILVAAFRPKSRRRRVARVERRL